MAGPETCRGRAAARPGAAMGRFLDAIHAAVHRVCGRADGTAQDAAHRRRSRRAHRGVPVHVRVLPRKFLVLGQVGLVLRGGTAVDDRAVVGPGTGTTRDEHEERGEQDIASHFVHRSGVWLSRDWPPEAQPASCAWRCRPARGADLRVVCAGQGERVWGSSIAAWSNVNTASRAVLSCAAAIARAL